MPDTHPHSTAWNRFSLIKRKPELILDQTPHEPIVCAHFGCAQHLTATQAMINPNCLQHQNIKPKNINLLIRLP